jgi:hypothetical protein
MRSTVEIASDGLIYVPSFMYILRLLYQQYGPSLWSIGQEFLATDQEVRGRFPALPDFLSNSVSGTGLTQPREYN